MVQHHGLSVDHGMFHIRPARVVHQSAQRIEHGCIKRIRQIDGYRIATGTDLQVSEIPPTKCARRAEGRAGDKVLRVRQPDFMLADFAQQRPQPQILNQVVRERIRRQRHIHSALDELPVGAIQTLLGFTVGAMNDVGSRARDHIHIILSDIRDMRGQHLGPQKADTLKILHRSLIAVSLRYGLCFSQMLRKVEVDGHAALLGCFLRLAQNIFRNGVRGMRRQMDAQPVAILAMLLGGATMIVEENFGGADIWMQLVERLGFRSNLGLTYPGNVGSIGYVKEGRIVIDDPGDVAAGLAAGLKLYDEQHGQCGDRLRIHL